MLKKCFIFCLLCTMLCATSFALAEDVVVTQRGTKYHKETCRLVKFKDNTQIMSKEKAVEAGYSPCRRCYKEDIVPSDASADLDAKENVKDQKSAKTDKIKK
jgi:methylphosphotriester-DNA--protein-cysteine methyltransferase